MAINGETNDNRQTPDEMADAAAGADDLNDLAGRLGDLARYLQDQDNVEDTVHGIVETAIGTVPGARYAGLSIVHNRRSMRTIASTEPLVQQVDQAQIDFEQGPCRTALYEKRTVRLPNMTDEERWPRFAERAAELGVHSMLSFQLFVTGDDLGALNLYADEAHAFTDESEQVGLLFAAHAAVAMADAKTIENLTHALGTRDLIGQAKGILMERYKVTGDQAFALLARASQHANTKLVHVARYLVDSGELITAQQAPKTSP